jgi:hypothetical protein
MEDKKEGKWREAIQNSGWKTCVSFLVDQSTTPSIARRSQTGILALDSSGTEEERHSSDVFWNY